MKHKDIKQLNFMKTCLQSLKFICPKVKGITVLFCITGVSFGLVSTGVSLVIKLLIDAMHTYSLGQSQLFPVILFLCVLFIAGALNHYLQMFFDATMNYFTQKTEQIITKSLTAKCSRIPLVSFEVTKTYDIINRANDGKTGVSGILSLLCFMLFLLSRLVSSALYFYIHTPLLALTLVVSTIPVFFARIIRGKALYALHYKQSPENRLLQYYDMCITGKEYFKETRLLNIETYFINKWEILYDRVKKEEWKINVKLWSVQFFMLLLRSLGLAGSFAISAYLLYAGEISIGLFSMMINLMFFLQWTIENFVSNLGNFADNIFKAVDFFTLMEQKEDGGSEKKKSFHHSIILENIRFKYPYTETYAINNISLEIKKGEKIALVGENGSGKSTLVKLLAGLYKPDSGRITYDGRDINAVLIDERFFPLSAVFQNFSRYYMTVKENIGLSESTRMNDVESVNKALYATGLPLKPETMLGRDFGGTELSGGEWQRLAIARGLFREHDIIILDEPTASIDPLLEAEIYQHFIEMSKEKTAIIITHRLGSTKVADRIILLENGTIIETGSHAELMAKKGKYSYIYTSQASWYKR